MTNKNNEGALKTGNLVYDALMLGQKMNQQAYDMNMKNVLANHPLIMPQLNPGAKAIKGFFGQKPVEYKKPKLNKSMKKKIGFGDNSKKNYIFFLLDKSGSMSLGKDITIKGFNEQLVSVREGSVDMPNCFISLVEFSSAPVEAKYVFEHVNTVEDINDKSYVPSGGTALYDGIGMVLDYIDLVQDKNANFLLCIFTDGEENASQVYTGPILSERITGLKANGNFTMTLTGPNASLEDITKILSLSKGNVQGYNAMSLEGRAETFAANSKGVTNYMRTMSVGSSNSVDNFYDNDVK